MKSSDSLEYIFERERIINDVVLDIGEIAGFKNGLKPFIDIYSDIFGSVAINIPSRISKLKRDLRKENIKYHDSKYFLNSGEFTKDELHEALSSYFLPTKIEATINILNPINRREVTKIEEISNESFNMVSNNYHDSLSLFREFLQTQMFTPGLKHYIEVNENLGHSNLVGKIVPRIDYDYDGIYYFKAYENKEDIIRESIALDNLSGSFFCFGGTNLIHDNKGIPYVKVGDLYFMISKNLVPDSSALRHFEGIKKEVLYGLGIEDDIVINRIYTLAALHTESRKFYYPNYIFDSELVDNDLVYNKKFIKKSSELSSIIFDSLYEDEKALYDRLVEKHKNISSNYLSHNDTKHDNWVISGRGNEVLVDFGISGFSKGFGDVELALLGLNSEIRNYYQEQYFKIRNFLSNGLEGVLVNEKEQNEFRQNGVERAYLDIIRLQSWYSSRNESKVEELDKFRKSYLSEIMKLRDVM